MGYHTVFDVAQVGFRWWIPLLIFVFSALFLGIGWALRTSGERNFSWKGLLFQVVGVIGILVSLGFFAVGYSEYHSAEEALSHHDYSVVEGVVTDFVPTPPSGHSIESFRVNGVQFQYGSGWGSTVFNSEWNTGFVHNGVKTPVAAPAETRTPNLHRAKIAQPECGWKDGDSGDPDGKKTLPMKTKTKEPT